MNAGKEWTTVHHVGSILASLNIKCKLRQDKNNSDRVYVRKGKKLTYTLKVYTKPNDSWRLYLYEQYLMYGIRGLSVRIDVNDSRLLRHIFESSNSLDVNKQLYINYFKNEGHEDLADDGQMLKKESKSIFMAL